LLCIRDCMRSSYLAYMTVILAVVRYPRWLGWAGFLSMALFRLPLLLNRNISFHKLLGCGKNGSFSIAPDWRQWALLVCLKNDINIEDRNANNLRSLSSKLIGSFIMDWWNFFKVDKKMFFLHPIEGHGKWDGKDAFGSLPRKTSYEGEIGVLTRASIRGSKAVDFWKHVEAVATEMKNAPGFRYSIGIGEVPWIKQATFSIWQSKENMMQFSYNMPHHKEVIQKTRKDDWYSEDMFVRFKILATIEGRHKAAEE
jgi:hypothetical protein